MNEGASEKSRSTNSLGLAVISGFRGDTEVRGVQGASEDWPQAHTLGCSAWPTWDTRERGVGENIRATEECGRRGHPIPSLSLRPGWLSFLKHKILMAVPHWLMLKRVASLESEMLSG